jgi:hypothetical protein
MDGGTAILQVVFNGLAGRLETTFWWLDGKIKIIRYSRSMPFNAVDGRLVTGLDGYCPSRPLSVSMMELSWNGTGTVTVLRIRTSREVRSRCAALVLS